MFDPTSSTVKTAHPRPRAGAVHGGRAGGRDGLRVRPRPTGEPFGIGDVTRVRCLIDEAGVPPQAIQFDHDEGVAAADKFKDRRKFATISQKASGDRLGADERAACRLELCLLRRGVLSHGGYAGVAGQVVLAASAGQLKGARSMD
jgi:hypothetical protein